MIYGREQFGGKGEHHECAATFIPMLPPSTSNYMEDPAGDLMLTQLLAGTDVFEDVGPATLTGGSVQEFKIGTPNWTIPFANAGQEQGFECVAGSIGVTGPRALDAVGVCGVGGSGLGQPVFTVTISKSAGVTQDRVEVSFCDAITVDLATTTGNYTTAVGPNATPLANQLKTPLEVSDSTPTDYFFTPSLQVNQRTSVTTWSSFCSSGVVNHTGASWLWVTYPGQSAIAGYSIAVDSAAAGLSLSHSGLVSYGSYPLSQQTVRGGQIPFSVYCSPYTGRGHIYVRGEEYTGNSNYPDLYHGTCFTFAHNLPTGPTDGDAARAGRERYAVGFRFDSPQTLPSGVPTRVYPYHAFSGHVSAVPRVLESTEPPFLPDSSTSFSDAERVMFLDMDGGPRTALYCDGGSQATGVADILSAEMGGNTYSANNVSSFSNTYPVVYQEDYTPHGTTQYDPNNVVRFTGAHRQSTVPGPDDITGLGVAVSFPYSSQITPTSSAEPLATCMSQIGQFSAEQYFALWSILGQHSLGSTRADGRWIGSNRYTTNDLGVGSTTTIDNLGTTAVPASVSYFDTYPKYSISYTSGIVSGSRYLAHRIGSKWDVTAKNRCISARVICQPSQVSQTASAISFSYTRFPIFGPPALTIQFSAITHLLFECVEAALYVYSGPHLGWSFDQRLATTTKTVEMSGICHIRGLLALTAAEQANFIAGNPVDIYCTPSTQSGQLVRTSQPGVDPTVKVTVTAVT